MEYLEQFSQTRRVQRKTGPYTVKPYTTVSNERGDSDIIDFNTPPPGQPGLWCNWIPGGSEPRPELLGGHSPPGAVIEWNQGEKFYNAAEWMAYLIDHFLKPGAEASKTGIALFSLFTFDHVVNGQIEAQGEDPDDRWMLIVENNEVSVAQATFQYDEATPIQPTYPPVTPVTQADEQPYWVVTERTLVQAESEQDAIYLVVSGRGEENIEQSAEEAP